MTGEWFEAVWIAVGSAVVYLTIAVLLTYAAVYLWALLVLAHTWWQNRGDR